jgi:hypothetical protein
MKSILTGTASALLLIASLAAGAQKQDDAERQLRTAINTELVVFVGTARSHHNMTAIYNVDDIVKVSGTLTKIDWRNPHIELDVNMKVGTEVQSWALEGPPPSFFSTRGVNKSDIETALNKTVTAEVSRARDGSHAGLLRVMTLPDGKVVCSQSCAEEGRHP